MNILSTPSINNYNMWFTFSGTGLLIVTKECFKTEQNAAWVLSGQDEA
jgi:hypothetical protein